MRELEINGITYLVNKNDIIKCAKAPIPLTRGNEAINNIGKHILELTY
jgi:hypothetical protein